MRVHSEIPPDLVITIDGPAGAGKSTVARVLARRLGYLYVDTGAMYRAVALKAHRLAVPPQDEAALAALLEDTKIELKPGDGGTRVFLDGVEVTAEIRRPEVNAIVSTVAAVPVVRRRLVQQQRRLAERGGVVLEGRDTGSFVAPWAHCKIFLTASLPTRIERRYAELRAAGHDVALEQVAADIAARDRTDTERSVAPLVVPEGAFVIDTTGLDCAEVVEQILTRCLKARVGRP